MIQPNIECPPYNYKNFQSDIKSIIHCINFLGEDIVGLELGTSSGDSFMTMLQNCPNIKTLYGVDCFKPHIDHITYSEVPYNVVDEKKSEYSKLTFYHNLKFSGHKEKVVFFEEYSKDVLEKIENESLDFIFIDTCSTYQDAKEDISLWYSKVKPGGIYSGHDFHCNFVKKSVFEFREENNITSPISIFDNVWIWYK